MLVVDGILTESRIPEVAALAARYCRENGERRVDVVLTRGGERRRLTVPPAAEERLAQWRI